MNYCLYEILFPNGKRYFGVTNDFARRWCEHRGDAKRGSDLLVHKALRKYGKEATARPLVIGERQYILDLEIRAVTAFGTAVKNQGYNISPGGFLASPETRAKYRAATEKRWQDPTYRERMILMTKNRKRSPEELKRLSASLTGRTRSQQHCANISKALTGRKKSAATIAFFKASLTPEVREKMGAATRGLPAKNGVSERNRARGGFKHSAEAKAKMAAGILAAWARKKAAHAANGELYFPNRKKRRSSQKAEACVQCETTTQETP